MLPWDGEFLWKVNVLLISGGGGGRLLDSLSSDLGEGIDADSTSILPSQFIIDVCFNEVPMRTKSGS